MKTLEQSAIEINGTSCVHQVKALRSAYVPEEDLKCRNCANYDCPDYLPVNTFEIPLNTLRFHIVAN